MMHLRTDRINTGCNCDSTKYVNNTNLFETELHNNTFQYSALLDFAYQVISVRAFIKMVNDYQ